MIRSPQENILNIYRERERERERERKLSNVMDPLADGDHLFVQHLSEAAGVAAALQSLRCYPRMTRKSRCQKASQERQTPSEQVWGQGQRQNMGQAQ